MELLMENINSSTSGLERVKSGSPSGSLCFRSVKTCSTNSIPQNKEATSTSNNSRATQSTAGAT
eukprot:scaffold4964_cov248-Ochromonas_danica.AAC.9